MYLFMLLTFYRADGIEEKKSNSKNENGVKYGELIILG